MLTLSRTFGAGAALYYTINTAGEFFCSTSISSLRRIGVAIEEAAEYLPELLVYSYVCPPATPFKNIFALNADDVLTFSFKGDQCRLTASRHLILPSVRKSASRDSGDTVEALEAAMHPVSQLRERAATLLSGGVDSSILCQLAARRGSRTSFSTSYPFEKSESDVERSYALTAAEALGVEHHHYVPDTERYLVGVIEAIHRVEVPLHGLQTALLSCLFQESIPDSFQVVINGDGADGVFGTESQRQAFQAGVPFPLERWLGLDILRPAVMRLNRRGWLLGVTARRDILKSEEAATHFRWKNGQFGDVDWVSNWLGVKPRACWETRRALCGQYPGDSLLNHTVVISLLGSAYTLQMTWARLAETTGRAMYYPFTDRRVVESGLSLPPEQRLSDHKGHLKAAARRIGIPEFILTRPKAHFGIVAERWAGPGNVLAPLAQLAASVVDEAVFKQVQGTAERTARVYWNLINYGIWHRLMIRDEPVGRLVSELRLVLAEESRLSTTKNAPPSRSL